VMDGRHELHSLYGISFIETIFFPGRTIYSILNSTFVLQQDIVPRMCLSSHNSVTDLEGYPFESRHHGWHGEKIE
jgi:hypothetical protein